MTFQEAWTFLYNDFNEISQIHLKYLHQIDGVNGFTIPAVTKYGRVQELFERSRIIYEAFFNEFVYPGTPNPHADISVKWAQRIAEHKTQIERASKERQELSAYINIQ